MNKKLFLCFVIFIAGCVETSKAGLFTRKTPEEKAIEKKELQTWIDRYNKLDGQYWARKLANLKDILNYAPKKFFTKSFGKHKRGLKEKIGKLAETTEIQKDPTLFLDIINVAQQNKQMKDAKKYTQFIISLYDRHIDSFIKNILTRGEKSRYEDSIDRIINKLSDRKIQRKLRTALRLEPYKKLLKSMDTFDYDTKINHLWAIIDKAPKTFFGTSLGKYKRRLMKEIAKLVDEAKTTRKNRYRYKALINLVSFSDEMLGIEKGYRVAASSILRKCANLSFKVIKQALIEDIVPQLEKENPNWKNIEEITKLLVKGSGDFEGSSGLGGLMDKLVGKKIRKFLFKKLKKISSETTKVNYMKYILSISSSTLVKFGFNFGPDASPTKNFYKYFMEMADILKRKRLLFLRSYQQFNAYHLSKDFLSNITQVVLNSGSKKKIMQITLKIYDAELELISQWLHDEKMKGETLSKRMDDTIKSVQTELKETRKANGFFFTTANKFKSRVLDKILQYVQEKTVARSVQNANRFITVLTNVITMAPEGYFPLIEMLSKFKRKRIIKNAIEMLIEPFTKRYGDKIRNLIALAREKKSISRRTKKGMLKKIVSIEQQSIQKAPIYEH
jgi:hypothetical protein